LVPVMRSVPGWWESFPNGKRNALSISTVTSSERSLHTCLPQEKAFLHAKVSLLSSNKWYCSQNDVSLSIYSIRKLILLCHQFVSSTWNSCYNHGMKQHGVRILKYLNFHILQFFVERL